MKSDRIPAALFIVFGIILLIHTSSWPVEAGLYPRMIAIAMIFLALVLFIFPKNVEIKTIKTMIAGVVRDKKFYFMSLALILFVYGIGTLGFFVALVPFLVAVQLIMGSRGFLRVTIPTVSIWVFIFVMFVLVLRIRMPIAFWMM